MISRDIEECKNGWMDDLQLYVLFNSFSVISGRWVDDNERLCAVEPRLWLGRVCHDWGLNPRPLDRRPGLNPLSYQGSNKNEVKGKFRKIKS